MKAPAPFLNKLYELVSDTFTDDLVSWEKNGQSFIVHKPTEFSFVVLPHYFKHNNFSSFIRQLNQYGFHKLHPDEWVFGHECFKWGHRDKLNNIVRKKTNHVKNYPINFHEKNEYRKKLEAEIDILKRYKHNLTRDILDVCRRQEKFLLNQKYIESILKKLETEINHLKSFIFGYFSRIISSEREMEAQTNYFSNNKYVPTLSHNKITVFNPLIPRINYLIQKNM